MKSTTNYFLSEKYLYIPLSGIKIPKLIYGTAWKKNKTKELVLSAISNGFRAIDTACQPKHYQENLVGEAIETLISQKIISRENLYIQTKFTSLDGQDLSQPLPYNKEGNLTDQVRQSIQKSLDNLQTNYLDCLLLHSPMKTWEETYEVWRVFEEYVKNKTIKQIGISNIYVLPQLEKLFEKADIKPSVVQNRFYMKTGYDKEIRKFCKENGILYQSFWTLTANDHILENAKTIEIAEKYNKTPAQIFFKYVLQLGIAPLTGTSNENHMKEDLEVLEMEDLQEDEIHHFNIFIDGL